MISYENRSEEATKYLKSEAQQNNTLYRLGVAFLCPLIVAGTASTAHGTEDQAAVERANRGIVGIIAGPPESTSVRMASELANVLDSTNDVRVLAIAGKGSGKAIEDLLYLRGIDLAIVHSDALEESKNRGIHPNITNALRYVGKLYNEEFHLLTRSGIESVQDLAGQKVNLGPVGGGAELTATTIFDKLGVSVERTSFDDMLALEKLKRGEIAAMAYVAGKPAPLLQGLTSEDALHFLSIGFDQTFLDSYLPAHLTSADYPTLIPVGTDLNTLAVSTVMMAYNWSPDHSRYPPISRFVTAFFSRLDELRQPARHPKWEEVALGAEVPGWNRLPAADAWLKENGVSGGVELVADGAPVGRANDAAEKSKSFTLATGGAGGRYNTVGKAIEEMITASQPSTEIELTAIESGGFEDNARLIRESNTQFALQQALYGYFARTGSGPLAAEGPQDDLRAIATLWRDAEHVIIKKEHVKTGTVEDFLALTGEKVSLGPSASGPINSNRLLFANLGIDIDKEYDLVSLGYRDSAMALQNGEIMGMSTPSQPPAGHILESVAVLGNDIAILEFTPEQLEQANAGTGLWTSYTIPARTYPGQDRDIRTGAKANFLAVRADVDDDIVYNVTKTLFENLEELKKATVYTRDMSLDEALEGLTVPLHPGALRYYKEIGLLPEDARPEIVIAKLASSN